MTDVIIHLSEPITIPTNTKFVSFKDIESLDDNSVDNILIQDLLDYILESDIQLILKLLHNKIKTGGTLCVQGLDIKLLCCSIAFDEIDISQINEVLYPNRKSIHTLHQMIKIIDSMGLFDIMIKKYANDVEYFILLQKL